MAGAVRDEPMRAGFDFQNILDQGTGGGESFMIPDMGLVRGGDDQQHDLSAQALNLTSKILNDEALAKADMSLLEVSKVLGETHAFIDEQDIQHDAQDLDDPNAFLQDAVMEDAAADGEDTKKPLIKK